MLTTTFELLHNHGACTGRYRYLAKALGGIKAYGREEPISLLQILDVNGLEDALWALRAVPDDQTAARDKLARLFACRCVRETPLGDGRVVWDLLTDQRSRDAVEVAERYALGAASDDGLSAARGAAWAAVRDAARDASWDASWDAAWDAAWSVAWSVAGSAAWATAGSAARGAAWATAGSAARGAAWAAARTAQADILREMLAALDAGSEGVSGVHFSGPNNSTFFTDCCRAAIVDTQTRCPRCGVLVIGHDSDDPHARNRRRWSCACRGRRRG